MGVHQARPPLPLYRRAPADLALPPDGDICRYGNRRSFPINLEDALSDCRLLRHGGYLALLDSPRHALPIPLQERPQNPPQVLSSVWFDR